MPVFINLKSHFRIIPLTNEPDLPKNSKTIKIITDITNATFIASAIHLVFLP